MEPRPILPTLMILLTISLISMVFGCPGPKEELLPIIDIFNAHQDRTEVPISQFGSEIEYVLLETNKDCQLGDAARYYLDKEVIVAVDFRKILLFSRKDGEFIKQVGHWGKDPHGYAATIFSNEYDYQKKTVYTMAWKLFSFVEYSIMSEKEFTINCPSDVASFTRLADNNFLGYIKNYSGNASYRLTEFSIYDTSSIHKITNYNFFPNTGSVALFAMQGWFYNFSEETYFYELFTDTIFRYDHGKLLGHFKIELDKLGQRYELQSDRQFLKNRNNFIMLSSIYETQNNIFIDFAYNLTWHFYCLYDKNIQKTWVTKSDKQIIPGYTNDLDGFVNFPLSNISPDGYAIGAIQAVNVMNWMDSTKHTPPASILNMKELNMSSNPLIMIVKLKK